MSEDYYLCVLKDDNIFEGIRKLTNDETETFFTATTFMHKLNTKLYFFRMVDYDFNELKKFEKEYNYKINYCPLSNDINAVTFEFIRLLHNYLSSVNLFLNQYEANVKRDYEGELFDEFTELRNTLYAENLSYKIIYELQNEMRHSKIPSFTIKAKRKDFFEPLEAKFYIQKDYLNFGKLKKDEQFKELDELIDINKHIENMNSYLFELAGKILKFELDKHIEYYDFLKCLIDEININGHPCVINQGEFKEFSFKPNINFIDEKFIKLIEDMKKYQNVF